MCARSWVQTQFALKFLVFDGHVFYSFARNVGAERFSFLIDQQYLLIVSI